MLSKLWSLCEGIVASALLITGPTGGQNAGEFVVEVGNSNKWLNEFSRPMNILIQN